MFSTGEGGPQDKARARALYEQACMPAQEDAKGCYIVPILAMVYLLTPSGRCLARPLPDYTPVPRPSALD